MQQKPGPKPEKQPPGRPSVTIQPSKPKEKGTVWQRWVNAHPAIKPYAALIQKWAPKYGVDPVYLGSLILFESGGKRDARSSAGALGLAQIHMPTWDGKQLPFGKVNAQNAKNPNFAVRFAAWYFSQGLRQYGDYDAAYRRHYNPGYNGPGPFKGNVPKDYVAQSGQLGPEEAASFSVEKAAAKQDITDPIIQVGSLKMPRSQFRQAWGQVNDIYLAYAGRRANRKEAVGVIENGLSNFGIAVSLSKKESFYKSPVWQAHAPSLMGIAKDILGGGIKGKNYRGLVAKAIVHNWDTAAFAEALRSRPEYLESVEFKSKEASLGNVYKTIFGEPDEPIRTTIKEATLGRWTPDQFAGWLRGLPEYTSSSEYQAKRLSFLGELGLITGGTPTLASGAPEPQPGSGTAPPNSSRVPGRPAKPKPASYTPVLRG